MPVQTKRALIVDDSKSARVVLSRVLEKLELAVDTTESAESALDYLRENRPTETPRAITVVENSVIKYLNRQQVKLPGVN